MNFHICIHLFRHHPDQDIEPSSTPAGSLIPLHSLVLMTVESGPLPCGTRGSLDPRDKGDSMSGILRVAFLNEKSYFDPGEDGVKESTQFLGVSELAFTFPSPSRHAQWEPGAETVFIHCPWNKGGLKNCHLLLSLSVMNTLFREG